MTKGDIKKRRTVEEFPDSMTVADLMEFLNIGQNKAYELVRNGDIDSFYIGTRNKRILKESAIKYKDNNKVRSNPN